MPELTQIHFEIPINQKKEIHKIASRKGISDSDYYRQMIDKQIINEKAALADQELDKIINSGKLPMIHTQKEFKDWLSK